jgi:hypothetical protein
MIPALILAGIVLATGLLVWGLRKSADRCIKLYEESDDEDSR